MVLPCATVTPAGVAPPRTYGARVAGNWKHSVSCDFSWPCLRSRAQHLYWPGWLVFCLDVSSQKIVRSVFGNNHLYPYNPAHIGAGESQRDVRRPAAAKKPHSNSQDLGGSSRPQRPLRNTEYILCLAEQISIDLSQQSQPQIRETLQRCKENANNNPRFQHTKLTRAHGPKGPWYEGSSDASDLWLRVVARMGILSNHAQPQIAGISATC